MILALTVGALVAGAVYLVLQRDLLRVVLGFVLLSHGANLLLLSSGGTARRGEPLGSDLDPAVTADPLPQAFVLTAIVIAFAITIVLLVLAVTGSAGEGSVGDESGGEGSGGEGSVGDESVGDESGGGESGGGGPGDAQPAGEAAPEEQDDREGSGQPVPDPDRGAQR